MILWFQVVTYLCLTNRKHLDPFELAGSVYEADVRFIRDRAFD